MTDIHGKRYLDLISGISVSALGHLHPVVVKAVQKQIKKYMHLMVYGEYIQHPQVKLSKILAEHLPEKLDNVYLTNSGSESIEAAMKLARRVTGRRNMVSMMNSYHGSTQGALSLQGSDTFSRAYRPLIPGIRKIRFGNFDDLEQIDCSTAGVFCETIQGEAGALVPDISWIQALRKRCTDTGTLLILDEIQAGMGRTGKLWAFEHYGIEPDILVLAKGLGGGMPIGAIIAPRDIMKEFTEKPVLGHITTFGGHPVSAAAALATMRFITDEKLWESVPEKENIFRNELRHAGIQNVSGKGLLLAASTGDVHTNMQVIKRCIEKGVVTDWFLFCDTALRISPPLLIGEKEIKKACRVICESIEEVAKTR